MKKIIILFLILFNAITLYKVYEAKRNRVEIVTIDNKMRECIKKGGQFSILDYSLSDDGSDYRVSCDVPQKELFNVSIQVDLDK